MKPYYFSHDLHARHDPKVSALISKYGAEGYGVYWCIVEVLHEQGGKLEKFPNMFQGLAHDLKQNEATLQAIVKDMVNGLHLLKEDETTIWSDRVLLNIEAQEAIHTQRVEAGRVGGIMSGKIRSAASSKTKQNEANEAKEKKRKEKKIKESIILSPTAQTLIDYWNSKGLPAILTFNKERSEKLSQRLKNQHYEKFWKVAIDKLSVSSFALGKKPSKDGTTWKVSIDWFLANDNNYVKALEGKYDDYKSAVELFREELKRGD